MSRVSYGADIFSPVRLELSFNESMSRSDIGDSLFEPPKSTLSAGVEKDAGKSKEGFEFKQDKEESSKETDVVKNDKLLQKIRDVGNNLFSNANEASPLGTTDNVFAPLAKLPNPSAEFLDPKKDIGESKKKRSSEKREQLNLEAAGKSSRSADKPSFSRSSKKHTEPLLANNFVTVRRSERNKSSRLSNPKKGSCRELIDIMPTHSEKSEDLQNKRHPSSVTVDMERSLQASQDLENKSSSAHYQDNVTLGLTQVVKSSTNPRVTESSSQSQVTESSVKTLVAESAQSRPNTLDLIVEGSSGKVLEKKVPFSVNNVLSNNSKVSTESLSKQRDQPAQIQANIIEKLIKDTVSYEFDGIRLQLYMQQLSLLKLMNSRMDEYEQKTDRMYGIIEKLLDENRQLRSALLSRH